MPSSHRLLITSAALALTACGAGSHPGFTRSEWNVVKSLSPLPPLPPDPTNKYADNEAVARFGQTMFFEKGYAGPLTVDDPNGLGAAGETGKVACATCHEPGVDWSDPRASSLSLGAHLGKRNSPGLVNVGYYQWFTWAGRLDSLWAQGASALESPDEAGDRCGVAHFIWSKYRDEYNAIFDEKLPASLDPSAPDASRFPAFCSPKYKVAQDGSNPTDAWNAMTAADQTAVMQISANIGKAIAAYERRLVSGPSPFDRFVAGDQDAISDSAKRGLKLFIGRGFCVECHSGPNFSDDAFHNLGVPQMGEGVPTADDGRYTDLKKALMNPFRMSGPFSDDAAFGAQREANLAPTVIDHGAFRTKDLRGVANTAPYFHDGCMHTLRDVIDFYNWGGGEAAPGYVKDPKMRPLNLTPEEEDDLVEFLRSLSGQVPAEWANTPNE